MSNIKSVDLHNHTTASDGIFTPKELVYHASAKGLAAIGITDHDTTDGICEAKKAGKNYGIEIIPGIELNAQEDNVEIHILGYYMDYNLPWFQDILTKIRDARYYRAEKMVNNLVNIFGMDLEFEDIIQKAGGKHNISRTHIARAMIDKGIVKSVSEAFEKYIGEGCKAYVKRYKLTVSEGINIIKEAGGVPVLAHPGLIGDDTIVERIISYGILGIEAYHSKHTYQQSQKYAKLAEANGLIITGGSDCHGDGSPMVGDVTITYNTINELRRIANL